MVATSCKIISHEKLTFGAKKIDKLGIANFDERLCLLFI